ncbi:MAG: LeuD/DmdB family oxidoreductase small subunit [Promethearchaeota archaeon]
MEGTQRGKAWILGDDVTTDDIISGKFLEIRDPDELATHAFDSVIADFASRTVKGDVLIAGNNFGAGSSREQAPAVLKRLGIGLVCATSFARIFFRNAINVGLPALQVDADVKEHFKEGDPVSYTIQPPSLTNLQSQAAFRMKELPDFFIDILKNGGAMAKLKRNMRH